MGAIAAKISGNASITAGQLPSNIPATKIADGSVSNTEFQYLDGATSNLQTQLNTKAPLASPTFTGTVAGITAAMVNLGNVNNTSDANKPVSTAQQAALDLKANIASPSLTGTPLSPTAAPGTNTTQISTTAFVTNAVSGLVSAASPALTGSPTVNGFGILQWFGATGIDAVVGANVALGTSLTGKTFLPLIVIIQSTTESGTISVVPVISIGTNSTSFNNIAAAITCTGLTANNLAFPFHVSAITAAVLSATPVVTKFTTPASGVAPVLTISIYLGGLYV